MARASALPITIGKCRSPWTSFSQITCESCISLMMILFSSINTDDMDGPSAATPARTPARLRVAAKGVKRKPTRAWGPRR